ncbi:MAG TPA: ASCH domain-containing protein [Candidatus Limnocylindria bacterium]
MVGLPRRGERLTDSTGLPPAEFGFPQTDLRRRLVEAILRGEKTATAGLLVDYEREGDPLGTPGDRSVVIDADDRQVAVIELTGIEVRRMADVDLAFAIDEGEGFETVADWREAHERFWGGYLDEIRRDLGDPDWQLTDDTMVVCERFRLVERL